MHLMETVTEKCEALSSLVAAVMVVVSGKVVRGYVSGGQLWFTCEGFRCFWLVLGHCGQVSGPGIHMGRRAPGKLRVVGSET